MTQEKDTTNEPQLTELSALVPGRRIIAIDPGTRKCGVAVSDETQTVSRPLPRIARSSWKNLLDSIRTIIADFDAAALVIGLPLESDGGEGAMSAEARRLARNFSLSLNIPVLLQDERVTSYEARSRLWEQGIDLQQTSELVDSEAAVIILDDLLRRLKDSRN